MYALINILHHTRLRCSPHGNGLGDWKTTWMDDSDDSKRCPAKKTDRVWNGLV